MQQISYANQAAAMAGRERFWLVDELEQLAPEDPVRVWVSWLCLYARDILTGVLPGAYEQQAAERYAREALMPEEQFLPVAGDPPAELAARFNVPVEQVDARLIDLAAASSTPDHAASAIARKTSARVRTFRTSERAAEQAFCLLDNTRYVLRRPAPARLRGLGSGANSLSAWRDLLFGLCAGDAAL